MSAAILRKLKGSMFFSSTAFAVLLLAVFVDQTGIGLIIPVRALFAEQMGATLTEIGLMASSFLLANFLFQMPFGWASDHFGRRQVIILGLVVRTIMPLLYVGVHEPWLFIALRFVDGIGAAAIIPAARAYLMDITPEDRRGEAFGLLGTVSNAGLLLGPAIGGFLAIAGGYTSPFWGGSLMCGLTLVLVFFYIHERQHVKDARKAEREGGRQAGNLAILKANLGLPLYAALVMEVGLQFGFGLFVTLWAIWLNDLGAGTDYIGITFIAFTLPMILFMSWGGRLSDRLGRWQFIFCGGIIVVLAHVSYGFYNRDNYYWLVLGIGALEGLGWAFSTPAIEGFFADIVPAEVRGRLQGMFNTVGTTVAFISATVVAWLYEIDHVLPFIVLGVVEGAGLLGGALIVRVVEQRKTSRLLEKQLEPQLVPAAFGEFGQQAEKRELAVVK